jgi:hypothetical protein
VARAEGTVNIEVKGALQGALEVKTLDKALARLDKSAQKLSSSQTSQIQTITKDFNIYGRSTRKVFDSFDKGIKMMGTGMTKFLGLALKSTLIQFGAFSAALIGIHALFVAGKYLHKAYAWGMTAMAGAAASAAVALGTAAAAIREQQAAMYAFTKGGAGEFVSGTNQARNAMRTLQSDAQLAGIGVQGLNKAYAAMAKSMKSSQIAQSGAMLKKLMDFGSAGQDPAAAADKVGALIEALNNSKTSMAKVKEAAKALGPQMELALKKAKVTSKKQMKELIMSGELAKAGGVAGQFEAVNSTLIGQAKSFFTQIKGEFADFGQKFLGPAKESMQKIFRIVRRDLLRVADSLSEFGAGDYMNGLVSIFEKVSGFFVKLIREWLPKTDGFFSKMGNWWEKVTRWFRITKENLKPFIEGAKAVEGIFMPILQALKSGFLDSFKSFSTNAVKSKETFTEIGKNLGGLITELFKLQQVFSDAFREALPFLSDVVKGITQVVQMMTGMLSRFSGLAGGPMAYMGLMILFRQMKGHKGGVLGKEGVNPNVMNVHAKNVYVGGQALGGTKTTPPGGPNGPVPTGPRGPLPIGPGRGPLALGQGMRAIGPGGGSGGNLPVPYTQGPVMYDNQGRPLRGGRRFMFDRRGPADYPNPDAKLVGRDSGGRFRRLIPGAGVAGTTGRVYEQVGYGPNGRSTYMGPGQSPIAAIGSGQAISDASGATQRRVLLMQQRYQNLGPGVERDQAAAWLSSRGHPLTPVGGFPGGGGGAGFSSGAGGGTPPPAGGGGMPGTGGPGTAPPGAGGAGPQYYSRPGFFSRASMAARQQAVGQLGNSNNLFQSKLTGRQWGGVDTKKGDGTVYRVTRKWDPVTGTYGTKEVGQYDAQTGHFRTRGMGLGTKLRYSGMTSRAIRDSRLGSAILGNADKGITGINNSMGAKMAVGMGMSMLSQHMAPEAQGAMALGGMVGQFNPLAGLAVGLGGAALNSRTAAGGAMTGAGAGAAIGTMIAPGIGTAVGAALGAITGAIAGFVGGMRQRAKEAKAAMGSFLDGISIASFRGQQGAIREQEATAALGGKLEGPGALSVVAGKNAAKYSKLQKMLQNGKFTGKYAKSAKSEIGGGALKGALVGGGAGALYGAAIGSAVPIIGTALGAGIGGAIGLVGGGIFGGAVGGVKSLFTRGKRNKDLKKDYALFKKILDDPDFKNIFSKDELKDLEKDKAAGLSKLGKEIPERAKAAELINTQQTNRMNILTKMTGKSGAELEVLAKKMGVNLYDSTLKMQDVVDQLGISATKTAQELKNMNIDSALKGISDGFDEAIKRANAPKIYDERGRAVYDVVKGGGDTASVLEALKTFQESAMSMSSDPITAFYEQQKQLGTLQNPGKLFQKNGAWAKMDPSKFFTPEVTKALQVQASSTEKGFATTASDQLTAQLAGLGMMANSAQMTAIIQNMQGPQKERFLKDMQAGNINIKDPFANLTEQQGKDLYTKAGFKSKEKYMANQVNTLFGSYGVQNSTVDLSNINKDTNLVADKMTNASKTFEAAVNAFNSNMASYFTDSAGKPEWWSKEAMKEIMGNDTSTPRGGIVGDTTSSRLSQTMARHNAINSSIPGRRTITSGYRTVALGSLNSDHVTGRALDLVGQNLGSYAVATRNAGGFAEFHGSGDSRHLHAVPGPGAIGDTLVPRSNQMGIATSATVTSGGSSYTFHINGGQNNPEEIANMVMAKIKTAEQRVRERI